MGIKGNKQSKIIQILLAPTRILSKVANFYTRSMISCAGRYGYDSQISDLPKCYTINSSASTESRDYKALLRAVSRNPSEIIDLQVRGGKVLATSTMGYSEIVARSYSVGVGKIGRIDEERPCSFRVLEVVDVCPRSRSCAVKRN